MNIIIIENPCPITNEPGNPENLCSRCGERNFSDACFDRALELCIRCRKLRDEELVRKNEELVKLLAEKEEEVKALSDRLGKMEAELRRSKEETEKPKKTARDGRFIAYDDGTVLDTKTRLMWAAIDNGKDINWHDAKKYCESYRGGGYKDWGMPTIDELRGIYDKNKTSSNPPTKGCIGGYHITELIHITCCCPWASNISGSSASYFLFSYGSGNETPQSVSRSQRALPVRESSK